MIANMINYKKLNPIVTEFFIQTKNISCFQYTILFCCAKRYYTKFYTLFYYKNKEKLQKIASHKSSNIDFKDFISLYKKCTAKPYSSLVIDATLESDNPLHFRQNLLERT